jgi:MotA/TolQ/ExbB proton channel family
VSEILEAVSRASKRSAGVVHVEMRVGLYSLATIACLAPWVGIFGTVWTFPSAFVGPFNGNYSRGRILAFVFDQFATSMWFTAFGLAVGLMSLWFYRYFTARLHSFDIEMENASLDLLNHLSRIPGPFTFALPAGRMFGEESLDEVHRDEKFLRRSRYLTGTMLFVAWCAQVLLYVEFDWLASYVRVPIMFGLSCLAAYPLWVKLLRRRPGGMLALASIICAGWSIAELLMGRHLP